MPDQRAIDIGRAFEATVSEALGIELTAASGNRWNDQGDNKGRGLLVSCKANPTTKRSWATTREELRDAIEMAHGTGRLPALALKDQDGAQLVLMRLEDVAELLGSAETTVKTTKRSERIRDLASTPLLKRASSRSDYDDGYEKRKK